MDHRIIGKLYAKTKGPNSGDEKVISQDKVFTILTLFQDRPTYTGAYKGAKFNQK